MRGSTIALLGRHGNTEASYQYDAYGVVYGRGAAERHIEAIPGRPDAFKRGTDYLYTGKRQDVATGLYDYGFRDYAPRLARFTSVDPIKDGRNWYAYVGADPVNLVDPLGLRSADDGEATGDQSSGRIWKWFVGLIEGLLQPIAEYTEQALVRGLDEYDDGPGIAHPIPELADLQFTNAKLEAISRLVEIGATAATIEATLVGFGASASDAARIARQLAVRGSNPSRESPTIRDDIVLSGGRSGARVKDLSGPPNSVLRGSNGRIYITNDSGQVVWDVTASRAKPVTPGVGFGDKVDPEPWMLELLRRVWGN